MIPLDQIINSDCNEFMASLPAECVNLVLTSPPYDKLRLYNGYSFDFETTARNCMRILKPGGCIVWVVADQTIKGTETGNSFRQALYFMSLGLNLHDTMIWDKKHVFGTAGNPAVRYQQAFEYIFVFSKGRVSTFNPIKIDCIQKGRVYSGTTRRDRRTNYTTDCLKVKRDILNHDTKIVNNIFTYPVGFNKSYFDRTKSSHPAVFPLQLANDQIRTWTKPLDVVYDPFSGSGTTCEEAKKSGRYFMGTDVSAEYVADSRMRLSKIRDVKQWL